MNILFYCHYKVQTLARKLSTDRPLEAGFPSEKIAENNAAMAYRRKLQTEQDTITRSISQQALNGKALDVGWNMTLAANMISANVAYGDIEKIVALDNNITYSLEYAVIK